MKALAPALRSALLEETGVTHGFFGRAGGVSQGVYASLNAGPGSNDDPAAIAENRARCARALGVEAGRLITLYQVHSARAITVDAPFSGDRPQADAMVTRMRGLALGVLAADCMPFLFVEARAGIIGAAHAGWRGALAGVLEAAIAEMCALGAEPRRIRAALGPCLRQDNFEVGLDVADAFTVRYPESERFFAQGRTPEKRQFDLAGFGRWRLEQAGVSQLDDLGVCTLASSASYFSYRASRRAGDADFGRNLSAIALPN